MTHGSLFSGIGGFDLAAEWMGWSNLFHCEWNPFGQKVLKHYWPDAESFHDITKTDFTPYANKIDILTGGFPCQPYSLAGKRKGKEDERHLWPQMLRAIREISPRWVVGENVIGLINWDGGLVFDEVQTDLEAAGYEVWPYVLPACAVNAPHRRDRVWFVAHARSSGRVQQWDRGALCNGNRNGENEKQRWEQQSVGVRGSDEVGVTSNTHSGRQSGKEYGKKESRWFAKKSISTDWQNFPTQPPVCTGDDGFPAGLDGITFSKWRNESIKAAGNAIVPQVALQIFKAIQQYENILTSN